MRSSYFFTLEHKDEFLVILSLDLNERCLLRSWQVSLYKQGFLQRSLVNKFESWFIGWVHVSFLLQHSTTTQHDLWLENI